MKKALLYGLTLALALTLIACGHNKPNQETTEPDPAATSSQADVSTPEPKPEPPATPASEPVADKTPAVSAETEDTQDQAEPAAQEPAEPEPVKPEPAPEPAKKEPTKPSNSDSQQQTQQPSVNNQQAQQPTGGNPLADWNKTLEEQGYAGGETQWTDEERAGLAGALNGGSSQPQQDTQQQAGSKQEYDPSVDMPSGTPITGAQSQQTQPNSGVSSKQPGYSVTSDQEFMDNATKALIGESTGDYFHIESWD